MELPLAHYFRIILFIQHSQVCKKDSFSSLKKQGHRCELASVHISVAKATCCLLDILPPLKSGETTK